MLSKCIVYQFKYIETIQNKHRIHITLRPVCDFDKSNSSVIIIFDYCWEKENPYQIIRDFKEKLHYEILNQYEFNLFLSLFKTKTIRQKTITSSKYIY